MPSTLLAIETATRVAGVAVVRGDRPLAARALPGEQAVSETLLPSLQALLAEAGVGVEDLDAIAISVGPGSFTGLRVGVATAKGLAFDPPLPVVPVSSLSALVASVAPQSDPIAALLDAQRGQVYAVVHPGEGPAAEPLVAEGLYDPGELARRVPERCFAVGEGLAVAGEALRERLGSALRTGAAPDGAARALQVGILGARGLARGEAVAAAALLPRYLRRAEAEVRRGRGSGPRSARDRGAAF